MSIELPSQVVWLLNLIGVSWPNVNEDEVRAFAGHVRDFASNIDSTHQQASATIQRMRDSYQGSSYEQLVESWAHKSNSHMSELLDACQVVAVALDAAADAIVAAKGIAIGELVGMAISFAADQAAAVVTLGAAEAAEALIVTAAKKVVSDLESQLEQHIMGEVITQAVAPLEGVVDRAVGGLAFTGLDTALGDPTTPGSGGGGSGFMVIPEELQAHAQAMRGHAEDVAGHATDFGHAIAGLNFNG